MKPEAVKDEATAIGLVITSPRPWKAEGNFVIDADGKPIARCYSSWPLYSGHENAQLMALAPSIASELELAIAQRDSARGEAERMRAALVRIRPVARALVSDVTGRVAYDDLLTIEREVDSALNGEPLMTIDFTSPRESEPTPNNINHPTPKGE